MFTEKDKRTMWIIFLATIVLMAMPACGADDGDSDGDGLTDEHEMTIGTNPLNADTDGDDLTDGQEVHGVPLRAANPVIVEQAEAAGTEIVKTDPTKYDTDGDRISDGDEVKNGTDPTKADNSASIPRLKNLEEFNAKVLKSDKTIAVVLFTNEYCEQCKRVLPIFEEVAKGKYKTNIDPFLVYTDNAQKLTTTLNVPGMPWFLFFKEGELKDSAAGKEIADADALNKKIEKVLPGYQVE